MFNKILKYILVITFFIVYSFNILTVTAADETSTRKIIVDAGHGGFDGGAVANDGTIEKNINLIISLKLGEMLRFCGYKIIYTRTDDTATNTVEGTIKQKKVSDMQYRLSLMNKNTDAVFVSIHLNKFTTSKANGAQVFYSTQVENSKILGENILNSIKEKLQPENTRTIKKGDKNIYLLYNATIPSVIVECGFLSNSNECKLLNNNEYQEKMAFSVFSGINDYYIKNK